MKRFYILTLTFLLFAGIFPSWASENKTVDSDEYVIIPFNASFVPGISIGNMRADGRKVINRLALNFVGSAAQLQGAELTYIWSFYSETVSGFQYSTIGNSVGDEVHGIQIAGIINRVGGDMNGLQYAGIINMVKGRLFGLHWAGIANLTSDGSIGGEWAGIANIVGGSFTGVQFAGITNIPKGNMTGGQWAGIMNRVPGDLIGVQFAGILNSVSGSVRGGQFTGIMNRADTIEKGVQVGLFNYAKKHNGATIGLISYVQEVGLHVDVWGDAAQFAYVGLRSGTERVHNLLFAGVQSNDTERWTAGWGIGNHFNINQSFFTESDLLLQHINEKSTAWTEEVNSMAKLRLLLGWQVAPRLAFYAGPTANIFVSKEHDGEEIAPWTTRKKYIEDEDIWVHSWFGLTAGIRF